MENFIQKYLEYNRQWAQAKQEEDAEYFNLLAEGQHPKALILGCSDSRVSPSVVIGAGLGEVFVHRNIANVVAHSDLNFLSVFQYAVEVLKVEHIIVVGHYGCGGIQAAMSDKVFGLIDNWLANIKDVMALHREELDALPNEQHRFGRLVELNVLEQINNIRQTSVYRKALQNGNAPELHGWVYDFSTGTINVIFGQEVHSSALGILKK
ncbi:MAG: carbonic anhydrase [Phaeodactylibacter sp.]|nr:carbonic anhydrase [Phaeodactylibacter sp.]MCB9274554.1 carbonic anhydrase [Lewinellaceae bacterium]